MRRFADRAAAGKALAAPLGRYAGDADVIVLGLPRGGAPVAYETARALHAPFDVLIVRKVGAPMQPEFALGAVASGGVTVVNEEALSCFEDESAFEQLAATQRAVVAERERQYRGPRPPLEVRGRTVLLVDDGAATGSSMLAGVRAARLLGAREVVAALPVASIEALRLLRTAADEVVCLQTPEDFAAVGCWYDDFAATSDEEVQRLLAAGVDGANRA